MRVEILHVETMKRVVGSKMKSVRFNESWDAASEGESCVRSIAQM